MSDRQATCTHRPGPCRHPYCLSETYPEPTRGDIVTYQSPYYGRALRVRLSVPIVTPHGKPGFDAVIINEEGEPDIAGYFFTSVWLDTDQIIKEQ